MKEITEFNDIYYENLLNNIKTQSTVIYERISSNSENITLEDDKDFISTALDTLDILLKKANMKNEDFLLELQSYLKRIQSLLSHYENTDNNHEDKQGLLHKYKHRILRGLLELEYEIGTV